MITVDVARQRVLAGLKPTGAEMVGLSASLGRVLASDIASRVAHPPVDVSSMDGYAVRAADLGPGSVTLPVVGESAAGHPFTGTVAPGRAIRIFTGAPMPAGTDCVVIQEEVLRDGDRISISQAARPGHYVRRCGQDFTPGRVLLGAGTVMGPRQIGLAAAMNIPWVSVHRRPRVAILSTGDEIVMPGDPLGPGQILSSNGLALAALVAQQGGEPVHLGIARDSRESLSAMVAAAQGCDLLVTSGGASVGDYDLVQDALTEAGLKLDFWKIALRPGKPLMFGTLRHVPVLGLPGNPVAALVCAYMFLRPMLRVLAGRPAGEEQTLTAVLGAEVGANDARQDYLRGSLCRREDGTLVATPLGRQDSGVISGLAAADALIIRPAHAAASPAGTPVQVLPLIDAL